MAWLQARLRLRLLIALLAWALAGAAVAQEEDEVRTAEPGVEAAEEEPEGAPPKPPAGETVLPDRPLMLRVGGSHAWDSNIFRAPAASSERIATVYAGLSVDKAYAQQRIRFDLTETAYRYARFAHLDFDALNYLGAWNWQLGPRIGGLLSAARDESLADYSEFRNPGQRNVLITENFAARADAWIFGGWHLTGGLTQVSNRYTVPFPQQASYRASGGEAGAKWVAPSANWLAFTLRSLDGTYLDRALDPVAFVDVGFRRRETELVASWRMAGKSSLDGRVAYVDYRSDNFAERDFSGVAARVRYVWDITGKLALNTLLSRDVEPWGDLTANHRLEERLTLGAVWLPAARTTLRLEASRGESEFREPLPGFTGSERRDAQRSVNLEAEWRALRNLSLTATLQRSRQSSTDPGANYSANVVRLSLSLLL